MFAQLNQLRKYWQQRLEFHMQLSKTRDELRHLSDDQLRDIGITREQAEAEANRNAWDSDQLPRSKPKKSSLSMPAFFSQAR